MSYVNIKPSGQYADYNIIKNGGIVTAAPRGLSPSAMLSDRFVREPEVNRPLSNFLLPTFLFGEDDFDIVVESSTAKTLSGADVGKYIRCTNNSAVVITIAPNSEVSLPIGAEVIIEQAGEGEVSLSAGTGVTINPSTGLFTLARYACITLKKVATDEWIIGGERGVE